jgi:hypothetical protein
MKLQEKNRKVYSWQDVGSALGMSRQAAQALFMKEPDSKSFIKYSTLAGIITFFEAEGMPVSFDDLLIVRETGDI